MKTIWKFPLNMEDTQSIKMPLDAEILSVQSQFDEPMMWCLVNPEMPLIHREIRIVGTGHEIDYGSKWVFIDTFQMQAGNFVFHVFDLGYKES